MIDTSLFGYDLPAGTYTAGDVVQLKCVDGPAVVRSGRGAAILKRISVGTLIGVQGSVTTWRVFVKNSDWVDPVESVTASLVEPTILDERTGCIQRGHDCQMTPNSSWEVWAVCQLGGTTTIGNSIWATIDIDYPSVSSIIDPDTLPGTPATIEVSQNVTYKAGGTLTTSSPEVFSIDIFKAGNEYALEKIESLGSSGHCGFISLSSAAGMGGLKRIMPIASFMANIRNKIEYASKLVKGPMDIGYNLFSISGTATSGTALTMLDFVKRRV